MLFYLWIMSSMLFYVVSPVCKPNQKYQSPYPNMKTIGLCKDKVCKNNSIIESGAYSKCQTSGFIPITKGLILVKLITKSLNTTIYRCDMNGDGIWSRDDCTPKYNWEFIKPTDSKKPYEIYVLECRQNVGDEPEMVELIDSGAPRAQLTQYDFLEAKSKTFQQHPTGQIHCVSQCDGSNLAIRAQPPGTTTECVKNMCTYKNVPNVKTTISCQSMSVSIIVVVNFDSSLVSQHERETPQFDAGETVSCAARQQKSTINNSTVRVSIPSVSLDIYKIINNKKVHIDDTKDLTSYKIPNKDTMQKKYYCYFGTRLNVSSTNFFKLSENDETLNVGSPYITIIHDDKVRIPKEDYYYNVQVGVKIHCDKTDYNTSSSVLISSFYLKNATYPLSNYKRNKDYVMDINSVNSITMTSTPTDKKTYKRYVNCQVSGYDSVPVEIYAGDKPIVKWVHINPPWPTEYYLGGFIVYCVGRSINDMTLMCTNCAPKDNLNVKNLDYLEFTQMLEVPTTNRINKNITYKCTGRSNNYADVHVSLVMNIIATQFKELDADVKFRVAGEDYIQCYSSFTVISDIQEKKKVPLKTFLSYSSGTETLENNDSKGILIPVPNGATSYRYCCPIFIKNIQNMSKSIYKCARFRDIDIARDYRVMFTQPLDDLFPGTKLKCYICVNFTTILQNQKCNGKNKIPSLLRMRVIKPTGEIIDTNFVSEVETPQEELKPDKSGYYPISDYKVYIACQSKTLNPPLVFVRLKSCNINPPNIRIHPQDRTMFTVGEIFSCTTDSVYCQNGLTYTIYIQRQGEPSEKKDSASFTLLKKHTGNNILIKCAAGETESKVDTRIIRVEIGPYNISINNVRTMMMYGQYFRCISLGFPPPTITWTQLRGTSKLRISENFMLIGPWDDSGPYAIACEAKNKRGLIAKTAIFEIFNPRIVESDFSPAFYAVVPLTTAIYIGLVVGAILVIFQENFFGVPFFSSTAPEAKTKGVSKAGTARFEEEPLPNLSDVQPKSSIAQTEKSEEI